MSIKEGLTEDEYLAVVERIQQAMCIEPFRPDVADVVLLIGAWQVQQRENDRLRVALEKWRPAVERAVKWSEQLGNERDAKGFAAMLADFDSALKPA